MQILGFRSSNQLEIEPDTYLGCIRVLSLIERGLVKWVDSDKVWNKCRSTDDPKSPLYRWKGYFSEYLGTEFGYFPYGRVADIVSLFEWGGRLPTKKAEFLAFDIFYLTTDIDRRHFRPEWLGQALRLYLETGEILLDWRKIVPRHRRRYNRFVYSNWTFSNGVWG